MFLISVEWLDEAKTRARFSLPGREEWRAERFDQRAPLPARQQERQPAERRMAEGKQRPARELVQLARVARVVQRLELLQPRRLLGDRGSHLLADFL